MSTIRSAGVLGLVPTPPAPRTTYGDSSPITSSLCEAGTSSCNRLGIDAQHNVARAASLLISAVAFSCLLFGVALAVIATSLCASNAQSSHAISAR